MKWFTWIVAPFRDPFSIERKKSKPPCNYDPNGMWRDYFDTLPEDIFTPKSTVEDRDLYDRKSK